MTARERFLVSRSVSPPEFAAERASTSPLGVPSERSSAVTVCFGFSFVDRADWKIAPGGNFSPKCLVVSIQMFYSRNAQISLPISIAWVSLAHGWIDD
jgi:hypothetical protein